MSTGLWIGVIVAIVAGGLIAYIALRSEFRE